MKFEYVGVETLHCCVWCSGAAWIELVLKLRQWS